MRRIVNDLAAVLRLILAAFLVGALVSSPASAQTTDGRLGWASPHAPGTYFQSAEAACRSQWATYMAGETDSRYIGVNFDLGGNRGLCSWTRVQYLCLEELAAAGDTNRIAYCGTVNPAYVELTCKDGYVAVFGVVCLINPLPNRPCKNSDNPQIGHPINLATCSKVLRTSDYSTADGQFLIGRSYSSIPVGRSASYQSLPRGLAGGWAFDFAYELQLGSFSGSSSAPNAKLALAAPDGSAYDFVMQSGGTWSPDTTTGTYYAPTNLKVEYVGTLPSDLSTLQSASTQWRVTDGDDTVWTFQTFTRPNTSPYAVGRPISRVTRDGYRWDFAYRTDGSLQTITDSFGRQATFNWSTFYVSSLASPPAGALPWPEAVSSVSLPDGTSLRYTYDPPPASSAPSTSTIARLIKVERLNSTGTAINSASYAYGDSRYPTFITSISDFNGDQIASYAYDSNARAVDTSLASGADEYSITNSETPTERIRTVTTPLGKVTEYHYQLFGSGTQDIRLTSVVGQASANTPASSRSIAYGSDTFIASETDAEGRVTTYTRDSRGRPTTVIEASGTPQQRTTTITWDSTFNVPDRVVRSGLQLDYSYTSAGQLQTLTETDTTTQSVPYSTNGQTRTWTYTWGTTGRLVSVNGPKPVDSFGKDDTETFAYDTSGNLQTSTNGLGQVTSFGSYDANGRPGTITDPNGIVTAVTYDTLGRAKTLTVKHPSNASLDAVTTFDYDVHDRVTGVTRPGTDKLTIDYDTAGRITDIHAASGERIDYRTDAHGDVTSKIFRRADGTVVGSIDRTFDELGRLLTQTLGAGHTTTFGYDKVGNLTQVTSARNNATQASFDPLNRLISAVAPDTGSSSTSFSDLDLVSSYTDPKSVQTTYVRDGFGDVIQEASPDRGTSTYYYNEAGELTAAVDGRGQRVDYTRDILGRITSKTPYGHSADTITYAWDTAGLTGSYGVGRLSGVTDPSGTTSFAYDHRGNLITKRQSVGSGTADLAYAYDLADRITQITYPSGRLVAYDRDSKGRVTAVSTKTSASDPSWTSLASSITYEAWGSITGAQFGNGLALTQGWSNGRLASKRLYTAATGVSLSSLAYTYDADGNIGGIHDLLNDANSQYYGYDELGRLNLASWVTTTTPSAETYSYTTGTNRLASLVDATGTRSVTYDDRGNTTAESRPASISVSASYDGYGRLLTYNRTGDPAQANAYNGLDERVAATSGSTTHQFVYDPDGRLVGEYAGSAASPVAETIWLSPEVATSIQPFGGTDGVAGYAPLALATGSGSGAALYWVHGNQLGVPIVTTDSTGAVANPTGYTVLGFPGQTKTLSDIYYNRYRDYDSSLGRYIQADPIGLRGGSNPYVYAYNNPLNYTDPSGRCGLLCAAAALVLIDYAIQKWEHPACTNYGELADAALLAVAFEAVPFLAEARFGTRLTSRFGRALADAAEEDTTAAVGATTGEAGVGATSAASSTGAGPGTDVTIFVDSSGTATIQTSGIELSSHAAEQATTRDISLEDISAAIDQGETFPYYKPEAGEWRTGYYDPVTNTFVGVGDRVTTVIRPRNAENYISNLMSQMP
jgi:RHS repeat-associated protein